MFETADTCENVKSLDIFIVSNLLALLFVSLFLLELKYSEIFIQLLMVLALLVLFVCFFFQVPYISFIYESNFCPLLICLALHIILSNHNSLVSGIPKNASPSPGTTKILHLATLSLCFNWTEQMPDCSMFELLYVFRITELFFVAHKNSVVAFGKA